MPITSKLDRTLGTLITQVTAKLHYADFLLHITQTRPQLGPGLPELFDARGVGTDITAGQMRSLSYAARDVSRRGELGATAFVASDDGMFGMARMYASLADDSVDVIHVFRDIEAATEWLANLRQTTEWDVESKKVLQPHAIMAGDAGRVHENVTKRS